jgi:hypothetical protein
MTTKTTRLLEIIGKSNGMRFTDIQRTLWEMSNPIGTFTRNLRGYWCTSLLGGEYYHRGLLRVYCVRGPDKLWRRNSKPLPAKPWAGMKFVAPPPYYP